jgi:hypothetical protein
MLASDEAALPVAGVAVGVIGRLTKDVDPVLTKRRGRSRDDYKQSTSRCLRINKRLRNAMMPGPGRPFQRAALFR